MICRSRRLSAGGLRLGTSTRYYKFVEEDIPAALPDQRIDPVWLDFKAGRDAVLEWIMAQKG